MVRGVQSLIDVEGEKKKCTFVIEVNKLFYSVLNRIKVTYFPKRNSTSRLTSPVLFGRSTTYVWSMVVCMVPLFCLKNSVQGFDLEFINWFSF